MKFFLFVLVVLFVHPAKAEQLLVSSFCQHIADYRSGEAEYTPGVDVNGNVVAPADLNAVEVPIIDPVGIPVEIDLADFFDLGLEDIPGLELEPTIADLEIFQDGRVLYNGQDISNQIDAECARENVTVKKREKPDVETPVAIEKNAVDAQPLDTQNNTDDDTLIEGQYP